MALSLYAYTVLSDLRRDGLFEEVDWAHLHEAEMPFIPNPDNATDTSYFDGERTSLSVRVIPAPRQS